MRPGPARALAAFAFPMRPFASHKIATISSTSFLGASRRHREQNSDYGLCSTRRNYGSRTQMTTAYLTPHGSSVCVSCAQELCLLRCLPSPPSRHVPCLPCRGPHEDGGVVLHRIVIPHYGPSNLCQLTSTSRQALTRISNWSDGLSCHSLAGEMACRHPRGPMPLAGETSSSFFHQDSVERGELNGCPFTHGKMQGARVLKQRCLHTPTPRV